jgi:AraC family transcriptional regulator, regulatory protein of adaptative response / methylated-DNA-[protein]-cysteine methyltransferase
MRSARCFLIVILRTDWSDEDLRIQNMGIETVTYSLGESTLGMVLVARRSRGICAILFGDSEEVLRDDLTRRFKAAPVLRDDMAMAADCNQVMDLIETPAGRDALTLDPIGTAFQRRVWCALREIPSGATASYADIAKRIDAPKAARAVAGACAANPIAVAIPCHRVVRGDGVLSGYRWGVARKRALLAREGAL